MFTLGMFVPFANQTGAVTGLFLGLAVSLWIGFGGPKPTPKLLPMSTDSCAQSGNMTAAEIRNGEGSSDDYFILYRLSYMWYVVIGCLLTLLVGVIVSYIVKWYKKEAVTISNLDLFSPLVRGYIKKRYKIKGATDDEDGMAMKQESHVSDNRSNNDVGFSNSNDNQNGSALVM